MKKGFTLVELLIILAIISMLIWVAVPFVRAAGPTPMPSEDKGAPKVSAPGFPTISTLSIHMNEGIGNFVQVDRIWNEKGDIFKLYFNQKYVDNNKKNAHIAVWVLEEYSPEGAAMVIADFQRRGMNTSMIKDMRYKYYQVIFTYADLWAEGFESEFDYEIAIVRHGQILDINKKTLYIMEGMNFRKMTTADMPFIKLAGVLKDRYNLK